MKLCVRKIQQIIRHAVSGMLPKNKLRDRRLERLKIFCGPNTRMYDANIVRRWEDGTLKSPRMKDVRKWERGELPEHETQRVALKKKRENLKRRVW